VESESCANVIVKIPGEAPLEMGPVFENEDRYEIDSSAVMNSASVLLLPGRPALYHVTVSSEPSCSGPSGLLHGEEHYFYIRGGRTQPVLTFSGGRRSNREGDFYRFQAFSYQGSELKAFEAWGEYCGPGPNCPVGDTDRFYMSRKLSLQRYRIEGMGAVPIGDIPLREESVIAFGQSEQPTPTISFVDDGTAGWLEFSTDYPLNLDSTALLLADQRWLDLPDQTPLPPRPGRWCWLYARVQPRGKPSPWHPVMPRQALQQAVAIAEFDPAEVEFVTAGTENNDETQNSAVAVWLNGHLLGFVVGAEQTCYSQGVRQAGPWGQLLDQKALNLYRRLFPPPFPETHRIVFAPGHSSATLHGVVEGGSAALYGARARKGQTLAVTADAEVRVRTIAGRDVRDDAPDPTRVVARLPRGGDYVIQATPAAGKTEFKLTVEIR
jgi:hypothetical protein